MAKGDIRSFLTLLASEIPVADKRSVIRIYPNKSYVRSSNFRNVMRTRVFPNVVFSEKNRCSVRKEVLLIIRGSEAEGRTL